MLAIIFLIPLIFVVFLLIFFRDKIVWWEYLVLILPSFAISTAIYFGMISYSESDTEYFGDYVTEIRYYEPWNEYIHKRCSYTTSSGSGKNRVTTTHYYDCSYVDYHPEKFTQVFKGGGEFEISKKEYTRLSSMWTKTYNIFVELNRRYHTIDGNMYRKNFDGIREHCKTSTISHSYKNKIKASHSIFGFKKIEPDEAKKMGLHDYPELVSQKDNDFFNGTDNQNPFIGYKPNKQELLRWQFINGYYGTREQFRVYLLFYYNQSQSIVEDQRDYWEGGNKNEMILCFGLDSVSKKIQWFDAFSWCDKPTFEVNFRNYMSNKEKVDLIDLANFTEYGARNYWVRKNFKDFDYIKVELTNTQLIWLFLIIILFNFGMSIYIIMNDFKH